MHASHIDAALCYEVASPAHFLLNVEVARWEGQQLLSESLRIEPPVPVRTFCDERSGNRFVRFDARPGSLVVRYAASVRRAPLQRPLTLEEVPVNCVPDDVLHCMMPTRYCESDLLARAAQQLFGDLPPGIGRVQAICDWIHETIAYEPGSTDSTTTAREVFVKRAGVCRDFAHLGVTLCRALNIPARLVVGYVWFEEPPQDFHAVFEAWLGGRWVLFDPTQMAPVDRLVRVGTGRDAKDVAFSTLFGGVRMSSMSIAVREEQNDAIAPPPDPSATGELLGIEKPVPVLDA
ncbi:MAG TPA: transglutaminase family protein [Variovorax sp.]|nr:transglutaminase family protein [Variovorax sp.]